MPERRMPPKPIRKPSYGHLSIPRVPYSEPLTPGLRKAVSTEAIGFTTELLREVDNGD